MEYGQIIKALNMSSNAGIEGNAVYPWMLKPRSNCSGIGHSHTYYEASLQVCYIQQIYAATIIALGACACIAVFFLNSARSNLNLS
jgi:hypothetical protein